MATREPVPARALPWLLAAVAVLPDPAAAWPRLSYFFRDFSVTFYPLRLFAARELQSGRWPSWNPYIYEGAFALPVLYPPDLLHAFWSGPVGVSFLLTLHLPLAALAAYALARALSAGPLGAFLAGSVYALGGLALSSLNLYVFLQSLALAPIVVLAFLRAAERGGRAIVWGGLSLALALSTLAVEFVVQGLALGVALGLASAPLRPRALRLSAALALGVGMAGLPVLLVAGMLSETARGAGFAPDVALGNEVHPVALLQALVPNLFGSLASPVESWWGGRFFTKGFPYFLSLYLGPLVLALAVTGARGLTRGRRRILVGGAALGVWYALGARAGLASVLLLLPLWKWFRFPSKAMLLPYLAAAILCALGAEGLRRGEGWKRFGVVALALGAVALGVAVIVTSSPQPIADWAGIDRARFPPIGRAVALGSLGVALVAAAGAGLAFAVRRGVLAPSRGVTLLAVAVVLDLARAGAGMNPQAAPAFFEPLPELASQGLDRLEGGRVFSYGPDRSPAFRGFLEAGGPRLALASFFITRQLLAPYNNVLDGVETPEAKDLTSFVPRAPELAPEDYDPASVERILPWLRNAAVSRVLSLDPLPSSALTLRATVPLGRPGLEVRVYDLEDPWPRAYVACRVLEAGSVAESLLAPYRPGFDARGDVALEGPGSTGCREGRVLERSAGSDRVRYRVESDGPGYLVARDSFARGWTAEVAGREAPVLRANGKHRAVPIPAGRHEVLMRYRPPGLGPGLALTGLSLAAAALLLLRPVLRAEAEGG